MRTRLSFSSASVASLVLLSSLSLGIAACSVADGADDATATDESELVQFPAAAFTNAPALAYGATSAAIATTRTQWGVVKIAGTKGEEILATLTATTGDRYPRIYLAEKRGAQYVSVLSGTNADDNQLRAKIAESKDYWIVFRERSRRNASFTVALERVGATPAACAGAPLVESEIVARTPQAWEPQLGIEGTYERTVRRCNVATGCDDGQVTKNEHVQLTVDKDQNGKWGVYGHQPLTLDGTTGELTGTTTVSPTWNVTLDVPLRGAATTSCVHYSGRSRVDIDAITYYDVSVSFTGATPAKEPRVTHPAAPPAPACAGEALIPDEELLARFPRGAAQVGLGQASVVEHVQQCHPQTGCSAWSVNNLEYVSATAHVLARDAVGVSFTIASRGTSAPHTVEDGTLKAEDILRHQGGMTEGRISENHLLLVEKTVNLAGGYKTRRSVCIPLPPHP